MELSEVITSRRSIRKFKEGDISADAVLQLLEAARCAPSGSNLQPARFIIAQSAAAKETLGRSTPYKFIVKAPVVFVCCADLSDAGLHSLFCEIKKRSAGTFKSGFAKPIVLFFRFGIQAYGYGIKTCCF